MTTSVDRENAKRATHLPGEVGIWLFIAGDLLLFSVLFVLFLQYRSEQPEVFSESQRHLSQAFGLLNTILMLSSSWLVFSGVQLARRAQTGLAWRYFGVAMLCGAAFVVVKYFEYSSHIAAGDTPVTNDFFMYYYVYTGIHLLHVLIGMGVLTGMAAYVRSSGRKANVEYLESGATFWHLVDLLWIVLFSLLYLVGQG